MTAIPSQTEPLAAEDGTITPHWYRFLEQIGKAVSTWERSFVIETPTASDYRVMVNVPVGLKITKVTTVAASGTATLTAKVNATSLGGVANSVSSTEQSQIHKSANVMSAGDDLVLTFSSVSAASRVTVTVTGSLII